RPLANTYLQFEDLAQMVARRAALTSPPPYAVIDSLPQRGASTDPRTQLATLAYYYLLADPETTFLCFYGGHHAGTAWQRPWTPAAAYDLRRAAGPLVRLDVGISPFHTAMKYSGDRRGHLAGMLSVKTTP